MLVSPHANDDIDGEAVFRELRLASSEDLDAPKPSFDEIVDQALWDVVKREAEARAWRQANRPGLALRDGTPLP